MSYNPKEYWEKRLSDKFSLAGVGYILFNEHYNEWLYRAKKRVLTKAIQKQCIEIDGKTVCDVGCGTGFFVDFYHYYKIKNITGIDIASCSIESLKAKYTDCDFINDDISSSAITQKIDRNFDILNIFDVLYHVKDNNSFEQAISNISKLLKKNGFMFITDNFGACDIDDAAHVTFRSKKSYVRVLNKHGIKIIAIYPLYHLMNTPIFRSLSTFGLQNFWKQADSLLAPVYYFLDKFCFFQSRSNLNLMVAQKVKT